MLRYFGIFTCIFVLSIGVFGQVASGTHDVQPGSEPNEYNIKTTITGLEGVDIARMKYIVDNSHTYKPSPNNSLFSDRNEKYIKFYVMAVPATGILTIEFGVVLSDGGNYAFPVEFQFSRNEEKQVLNLPDIKISGAGGAIAMVEEPVVVEVPEPIAPPVVEEEPVVVEVPEPVAPPVVEEEPVVVEVPEPVAPPVVEEEPVVVEVPEPVAPPVVEEEPAVVEVPEPVAPPVIKEEPEVSRTATAKYTVQILSLSNFSQNRLNTFCNKHNLPMSKISKRTVGSLVKITYGEVSSIQEASKIKQELAREYGINESFVTSVK